jgi:hypothetical protein
MFADLLECGVGWGQALKQFKELVTAIKNQLK